MLGVKNKAKIEKLCLILSERAVRTHNTEKILRCREMILWIVYIKTLAMEIAAVVRVSLRRDYRKACEQLDRLAEHIFEARFVRIFVISVQ